MQMSFPKICLICQVKMGSACIKGSGLGSQSVFVLQLGNSVMLPRTERKELRQRRTLNITPFFLTGADKGLITHCNCATRRSIRIVWWPFGSSERSCDLLGVSSCQDYARYADDVHYHTHLVYRAYRASRLADSMPPRLRSQ